MEQAASGVAAAQRTHASVVQKSSAKLRAHQSSSTRCELEPVANSLYLNCLPVMSNATLQLVP